MKENKENEYKSITTGLKLGEQSQIVEINGKKTYATRTNEGIEIYTFEGNKWTWKETVKKNEIQSEPPPQINEQKSCTGGTIISCYTNSLDKKGVGDFPISDIVGRIKSPKYKTVTEKLRSYSIGSEEASDYKKKNFVAVTFSGTFAPSRAKANLQAHTGLLCLDFDKLHLESFEATKAKIQADLHTYICFVSPSGNGLKVVVKLADCKDENTHLQYFLQLEKYYLQRFDLQIDKQCKNVDRLCFLPYDENIFVNESVETFELLPFAETPKEVKPTENNVFEWCLEQNLKSQTFTKGNRNNFVNKLAYYANKKGVDFNDCLQGCLDRFVESDFTSNEIRQTVKSVYTTHKDKFNSSPYEVRAKKENEVSDKAKAKEENFSAASKYIRVGTQYYKKILTPILRSGDLHERLVKWNKGTIREDEGNILAEIVKYDEFCIVPNHLGYKEKIGECYNRYRPLSHQPEKGDCTAIIDFLKHIAGEQYDLLIEYCKLLYLNPTQRLPILCLVSKEKGTGKSTFINLLKRIFGLNMTLNRSEDFYSQFNDDWTDKLIVAVEETFFDKREISEKIKNISTAETYKTEGKSKDKSEIGLFIKVILCSNQEENFIKIEADDDGRFWVMKVKPFAKDHYKPFLLEEMTKEIPYFLDFLSKAEYINKKPLTRFWFCPEQTNTEALFRIMQVSDFKTSTIKDVLKDKFLDFGLEELHYTASDLVEILEKEYKIRTINQKQVGEVLRGLGFTANETPNSYEVPYFIDDNIATSKRKGRFYIIEKNKILK